jgi:uncharacterized membrane protein YfcA
MAKTALLATLVVIGIVFIALWATLAAKRQRSAQGQSGGYPSLLQTFVGFFTNFFDTLGIGSFATTTTIFKLTKMVDDRLVPGTLNTGHALPTIAQALIYIAIVKVDFTTLVLLIAAAVAGAWLGAGIVSGFSRRAVQIGMGTALFVAAGFMLASQLQVMPGGGTALALTGTKLGVGLAINFVLGALMTLGIGLYAPCMIMISLLGMDPTAAFPIMMGSCAFLMPIGGLQFVRKGGYDLRAAVGLAIGGIPGVLIAALWVVSLSLDTVRWLVVAVVIYTAAMLLRSAMTAAPERARGAAAPEPTR